MSEDLYKNIELSDITKKRRQQIKNLQDEFMTFSWGGVDAFNSFGAFIINGKQGDLKFYNGPSFSNEYTKPQFDNNGGDLMGVTFNRQTISFTIGVYWIGIKHYRLLLDWLHPLKVDYLQFGFNKQYRYNVKLSKIGDSPKYILGKEEGDYRYYTELSLSFEIQGTPCAIGANSYEWIEWNSRDGQGIFYTSPKSTTEFIESDLPTPLEIPFNFKLKGDPMSLNREVFTIVLDAEYIIAEDKTERINLFTLTLKNLTFNEDINKALTLSLAYYSETGLLFLKYGNSNERLLNLLNTTDTGEKLVESFTINKFFLPGRFNYSDFTTLNFSLRLITDLYFETTSAREIICYPRTNII